MDTTNSLPKSIGDALASSVRNDAALSSTYERGVRVARAGNILSCQAALDGSVIKLAGKVAGSYGSYDVRMGLDCGHGTISSHNCTCPAHAKYSGLCKHCVALALNALGVLGAGPISPSDTTPIRYLGKADGMPAPAPAGSNLKPAPKPAPKPKPVPKTSPEIARVVGAYTDQGLARARRLAPLAPQAASDDALPPAELQCLLMLGASGYAYSTHEDFWSLGLRISRGKASYIVKDINQLLKSWRGGLPFTYGKNLSFVHHRGAFSDRANELLAHLSEIAESQQSLYAAQEQRSYRYYSYDYQNRMSAKQLPLSTAQLMEVLDIVCGTTVSYETEAYEPHRGYHKVKRSLLVTRDEPRLTVSLSPAADAPVWEFDIEPHELECMGDKHRLALATAQQLHLCSDELARDLGLLLSEVLPLETPLVIREADMPSFCAAVLPALRRHTECVTPDGLDELLPPDPQFDFRIGLADGRVSCSATVTYGDVTIPLFAEAYDKGPVRSVERETEAQQLVGMLFPFGYHRQPGYGEPLKGEQPRGLGIPATGSSNWYAYGNLPTDTSDPWFDKADDDAYYLLFSEGLAALSELGEVYLDERLRHVSVRQAPAVTVEARVAGGLLDLAVSSEDMNAHELMAYLSSYRRHQRFVRLDNGDIVRLDGSVQAIADLADGLGVSEQALVEGLGSLPANRTLFVDAMLKRADGVSFGRNAGFRQIVRDFETVADADFAVPATVHATMRPYQTDGFRWLCTLGKTGFGGILADDMGLGKTLQAIAYLAHAREEGETRPSLVVCPASLVYNWQAELERFCPALEVAVVAGAKRDRTVAIAAAPDADVLVTSYDLMKRDVDAYEQQDFHCIILDEAQYIKNANTLAARAAKRLPAQVRLALTGTPIENRLSELWSIFDFLMPGVLGAHDSFNRRFATPIAGGDEACAERLRRLVGPFILRRLKRDVLRDLPDKNESLVTASLAGEQAKLYRASAQRLRMQVEHQLPEEFAGMRLQVLAELTKLRQICCDPHLAFENYTGGAAKLDTCMELVASAVDGGHQMLVFSQFTSMLERIAARLDEEGVGHLTLTGATSKEARQRLVRRFQEGEVPVFLISLKAGGVGLNLTAADIVIHFDPWWNVAAEDQATDRAHRIGQTREVSVFKLVAKDTIEEKIIDMQQAKRALADAVIGGEAMASTAITRDDILALLEG